MAGAAGLLLLVAAALTAAPAHATGISAFFGAAGSEGGQFSTAPAGLAVDNASGDIYVADAANNRIEQFASDNENAFIRTWGVDVVKSGAPNDLGTDAFEICDTAAGNEASDCKAGLAAGIGGAMNAPQGIAVDQSTGNLYVTDKGNLRIDEFDSSGHFIRAFGSNVVATGPGDAPAQSEVQTLTVTATSGKYTLEFQGAKTEPLEVGIPASGGIGKTASVQNALLALIGTEEVSVSGANGGPYTITFKGFHRNNPEPPITAASSPSEPLTGGTAEVVETTPGASGAEICSAAADVCQAGVAGQFNRGGGFQAPLEGYPAIAPGGPYAGDLFVADSKNLRIQIFAPDGAFLAAFGSGVLKAGPQSAGSRICLAALFDACGAGGSTAGNANEYGFSAGSDPTIPNRPPQRLGIDSSGAIYIPNDKQLQRYAPDLATEQDFATATCSTTEAHKGCTDVAVDPTTDDLYIARETALGSSLKEFLLERFDSTGAHLGTDLEGSGVKSIGGLALDASTATPHSGLIYFSTAATSLPGPGVDVIGETPTPPVCSMNPIGEVGTHGARLSGTIDPEGNALHTRYRFEYITPGEPWKPFPLAAVDIGNGADPVAVTQTLEGLRGNSPYRARLVAEKGVRSECGEEAFHTQPSPPAVQTGAASWSGPPASGPSLDFEGRLNPESQDSTYRFEYGPTASYGHSVAGSLAASPTETKVRLSVRGLDPSQSYHYRLLAVNGSGGAEGADREVGPALAGVRYPELVSPADKRPAGNVQLIFPNQLPFQAAADGQGMAYPLINGIADSSAGGELRYLSRRGAAGWAPEQLSGPSLVSAPRGGEGIGISPRSRPSLTRYLNPDLGCGIVESFNPLSADTPTADLELGVTNLYRRNADATYTLITPTVPLNPSATAAVGAGASTSQGSNAYYGIAGISADCSRAYFSSSYELLPGASGLYEWHDGALRDAGILPDGTVAAAAGLGGEGVGGVGGKVNAISSDGSRLFFSATSNQGPDAGKRAVFLRQGTSTTDVSQTKTATAPLGARYETASADGRHVFFAANYHLTSTSSSGPAVDCTSVAAKQGTVAPCDLYDYDVEAGSLTDLSADPNPANPNGASVDGILATSADGSYVYFAARGQLVPGEGRTYAENSAGNRTSANVYLAHAGALSFVGVVDQGAILAGTLIRSGPEFHSSQATPDGTRLLFASSANVTGYDSGGVREAYLYSAAADTTVCVSCRPDGQLSAGESPGGPIKILAGSTSEATYEPRSLSADGRRVFFTMKDALAPGAVAGKFNLYQWEQGQVTLLGTFDKDIEGFLDAGASGEDVFIATRQQLVPADTDSSTDVYDLRVDGGFPAAEAPPPPCDPLSAPGCQEEGGGPPSATAPASASLAGPGNPPLAKPPCPKGKVKKKGKCVLKHGGKKGKHHKKTRHKKHPARHRQTHGRHRGG